MPVYCGYRGCVGFAPSGVVGAVRSCRAPSFAASMRPAFRRPTAQYAAATFTVDRLIEMLGTLRCVRPRERMRRCRPDSLSIDPFYACLRCAVTEDDIKFFEGNPARRYRIRELQRT